MQMLVDGYFWEWVRWLPKRDRQISGLMKIARDTVYEARTLEGRFFDARGNGPNETADALLKEAFAKHGEAHKAIIALEEVVIEKWGAAVFIRAKKQAIAENVIG